MCQESTESATRDFKPWNNPESVSGFAEMAAHYSRKAWEYPGKLHQIRVSIGQLEQRSQELKSEASFIENELYERMLDDKALTSDVKRKAGLAKLHKESTSLQAVLSAMSDLKSQIRDFTDQMELEKDRRRALESSQTACLEILKLYQFQGGAK